MRSTPFSDKPYDEYAAYGNYLRLHELRLLCRQPRDAMSSAPPDVWSEIAVAHRRWANLNPIANYYSKPLTKEDYMAAPCLAWPFRGVDATTSTDGGRAVIITTAERAKELKNPLVTIRGFGVFNDTSKGWQLTPGDPRSSALIAGKLAYEMAGLAQRTSAQPRSMTATPTPSRRPSRITASMTERSPATSSHREHRPRRRFPVNTGGGLPARRGLLHGPHPAGRGRHADVRPLRRPPARRHARHQLPSS